MNKLVLAIIPVTFLLSACAEEAESPVRDDVLQDEGVQEEPLAAEPLEDATVSEGSDSTMIEQPELTAPLADEEASTAMEEPEAEEEAPAP
ncbi:hypothetical protein [Parasphingorhabdus sp.]|uniref:hypothetical protein n=1 Tax=Parasphingorhabdus sp. TaxID=2709688 RepID=UPI00326578A0